MPSFSSKNKVQNLRFRMTHTFYCSSFVFVFFLIQTGSICEQVNLDENKDWESYWRLLFPRITVKDIEEFSEKYKGNSRCH